MNDCEMMACALQEARRGLGRTSPNPPVGSVIAAPDGQVIATGYHACCGQPHAEAVALAQAGERARGATLYCTLEPCCHYGRTPPCAEAIVAAGVARVVYAVTDPDPRCAGGGEGVLREGAIEVTSGVLEAEVLELYEPYFKHKRTGLPFLTLKMALTLDGKAATSTGDSRWITGEPARELVHHWRDESDAVLVGAGTLLADDPRLTARIEKADDREPLRVIADSQARTPLTAQAIIGPGNCLIAVGPAAPAARVAALKAAGATVVEVGLDNSGKLNLSALLAELGRRDVMSVLCEGGPTLAAALVQQGLIDKYRLFYAPKLAGADAQTGVGPLGVEKMSEALNLNIRDVERVGEDILVTAYPDLL
ncbi:MAG: bifunctional diaminohydroxyphosphoribosylaminopyrimidine deaminase/5-amino-6-(5-phosphoribosylamino)uracil reductase RibD [Armatimonadota bacterium]